MYVELSLLTTICKKTLQKLREIGNPQKQMEIEEPQKFNYSAKNRFKVGKITSEHVIFGQVYFEEQFITL